MVTLYSVVDVRTMQYHSVVICKARMAKYFVPADEE